jgi:hypothetical protein
MLGLVKGSVRLVEALFEPEGEAEVPRGSPGAIWAASRKAATAVT